MYLYLLISLFAFKLSSPVRDPSHLHVETSELRTGVYLLTPEQNERIDLSPRENENRSATIKFDKQARLSIFRREIETVNVIKRKSNRANEQFFHSSLITVIPCTELMMSAIGFNWLSNYIYLLTVCI